jgi:hypothetical protein
LQAPPKDSEGINGEQVEAILVELSSGTNIREQLRKEGEEKRKKETLEEAERQEKIRLA